jgi:hypothetical protein
MFLVHLPRHVLENESAFSKGRRTTMSNPLPGMQCMNNGHMTICLIWLLSSSKAIASGFFIDSLGRAFGLALDRVLGQTNSPSLVSSSSRAIAGSFFIYSLGRAFGLALDRVLGQIVSSSLQSSSSRAIAVHFFIDSLGGASRLTMTPHFA